jgi:ATP-dependent helicase/nuclease subunit A
VKYQNLNSQACVNVSIEANAESALSLREEREKMALRRYQKPQPKKHGKHWTIVVTEDVFRDGQPQRRQRRIRLAPLETKWRQVLRLRDEYIQPLNQGLLTLDSAQTFQTFVRETYIPNEMTLLAKTTEQRYRGILKKYLLPRFGTCLLRDLRPTVLQRYFSLELGTAYPSLSWETNDKIRDVLASVLKRAAKKYGFLDRNPMEQIELPRNPSGRRKMPYLTPEQFDQLANAMPEPYATMVYVAIYTGLRISELIALRWQDLGPDSISIEQRYCRGDWSKPKSRASNATIAVDRHVIDRIHRLKELTVEVKAGGQGAVRRYRLVKPDGPHPELVFQSLKDGKPMRDNNVLTRWLKPAARTLGLGFANWRCLRTSRATWMVEAGANPKDVQGLMRHSHIQTTLDVYAQQVPESQRRAIEVTTRMAAGRIANARQVQAAAANGYVN